ncbi:hypothetical protein DUI87_16607 [Hirundo rustica rustica]|uniref:Uncharacterized protein n=1 Tax=Hirundo rustica rustica TaxID=333673 RepID=A0A3M0K405_HIRRU|nr:hypothetical protein DUI87_16607 [Hirundo rustica rustica]
MTALTLLYAAWETLRNKHLRNPGVFGSLKSPLVLFQQCLSRSGSLKYFSPAEHLIPLPTGSMANGTLQKQAAPVGSLELADCLSSCRDKKPQVQSYANLEQEILAFAFLDGRKFSWSYGTNTNSLQLATTISFSFEEIFCIFKS